MIIHLRGACVTPAAEHYQQRVRIAVTDDHSANGLTEKSISHISKHVWQLWHFLCEVHVVANIYGDLFVMGQEFFQGVLHSALSTRTGATMHGFRKSLQEEIKSRKIEILQGAPPRAVTLHRRRMILLFSGDCSATRSFLFAVLPNGNWLLRDRIQLYVEDSSLLTQEKATSLVCNALTFAVAGSNFEVLNRSRWLKNEKCLDRFGILESIHGLGRAAFRRFTNSLSSGKQGSDLQGDGAVPNAVLSIDDGLVEQVPDAMDDGKHCALARADHDEVDFAKRNSKSRAIAARFWTANPMGDLILYRTCLEPLRQLMRGKYDTSGEEWEAAQTRKLGAALQEHAEDASRGFRIKLAANNIFENTCIEKVNALLQDNELWQSMPVTHLSVCHQARAFRLLSRIKCAVQQKLKSRHVKLPVSLFCDADDGQAAVAAATSKACMRDALSNVLIEAFGGNLQHEKARAVLEFMMHLAGTDTVPIERTCLQKL